MLPLRDDVPTRRPAVFTMGIIVACAAVYFLVQPVGRELTATTPNPQAASCAELRFDLRHAAIPYELTSRRPLSERLARAVVVSDGCPVGAGLADPHKNLWLSVLATMFLHGGLLHLAGNMLYLWIFGNNIEDREGPVAYLLFYALAGLVSTAAQTALDPHTVAPLIGASGAIAGVMGAYLVLYPRARVLSLVLVFPLRVPAWLLLGFWFVSQFYVSPSSGVAWAAHVGGFLFGVLAGLAWRTAAPARTAGRRG